ncbi:MAG: precorrin-3B C(17)-methyltransferase [Rhodospirillales bacterium RIFCSPLOWO2_12_FULL_58_28]|nr:MAG: precorrin-3B C(17)-methyltransferase [Rhodospirillales bacterium RIFCSPLOWO2_02_FULL_58_16]OHC78604.1 MAG: precorrin-3B C(17)-methyltransferase [Rhodospirillales bacterium RIFCSPLOWO2_12_FULL_58_28]
MTALTPGGLELARRLREILPGSRLHGPEGSSDVDVTFSDAAAHLRTLFTQGTPIVGVCAAGILVRALAPLIADKRSEPPVVAVAVDGSAAVPILGGHNGANRLARAIADVTGGIAAITTAGDARFGLAVDDPPSGWHCLNPEAAKGIAAALLADLPVGLTVEAGNAGWLTETGAPFAENGELSVIVTDRVVEHPGNNLVLHPQVLAVGVGCERDADPAELVELVEKTLADAGLSAKAVACVVSIDLKADEKAVHAAADFLGVPARFFTADELEELTPRLANPSGAVFKAVGCHGVAEAAALAAGGPDSALAVGKKGSRRATCAVARARDIINPTSGRRQGRLTVVGIGPGSAAWRTPEATEAIREADDVVGYGLYLDLIGDLIVGKTRHESKMTQEEKRARKALDLAAEGKSVVLVSSGDAGIYGLASLVFELLERENKPEWNRLAISVVPGVSALQAAAARIGAPIGHDFCTISLSDLLTPLDDIKRRLQAAADGDFVVALYNPVSNRRRTQLPAAREILLTARPKETPVVLARNLGREEETLRTITLGELTPDHADMLTLVLIGNSRTKAIKRGVNRWVFTPRGYAKKML